MKHEHAIGRITQARLRLETSVAVAPRVVTAIAAGNARTRLPLAVAVERERIAQDLNRYTIHRLFGIGLKLQGLAVGSPGSATSEQIDDCVHELDLAISDLRRLIFSLGPRDV